jgi:RNA polymerase sigma factor (sigma-70 family)
MMDLDDQLPAIKAGDPDAFGRWVSRVEVTLRESLRSFAAVVDTEAVLQEALLRVWQVAPRFEPDGRPNGLFRLAVRIARNHAISERRRIHGTASSIEDIDERDQPNLSNLSFPDPILRRLIEQCRDRIPEKPRLALVARIESAGADDDESLAMRLQMRVNTFHQNFTRARKLLGDCLRAHGVDMFPAPLYAPPDEEAQ